jgi:NADH-quinone oxidoreductase subunit G
VEDAGSLCTFCPAQCNVTLTVRDERALRVLARENAEVDDGWLCDKGRFAYQSFHVDERVTQPLLRDGGFLRPVSWERALQEAAAGLRRAGARTGALAGGQSTNEEGFLLARLLREGLGSPHLDSRRGGSLPVELHRALGDPALQARTSDLEFAHAVLVLDADPVNDAPIFDLRLRKGVRRNGMKLAVATPQPSSLDGVAALSVRYAPGAGAAFAIALQAALADGPEVDRLARAAGADAGEVQALAALLIGAGEPAAGAGGEAPARERVVVWGERLTATANGAAGAAALLGIAAALEMDAADGAGLLEIPSGANGRGLREAGVLPGVAPGLGDLGPDEASHAPRDASAIAEGLAAGELSALYLLHRDPLRDLPDRELWIRAMSSASTVIAHASFLTEAIREHADVVFPAEAYAEKEGTIVHPDGRLQRLRPAIARPGDVRAEWQVLAGVALSLGLELDSLTGPAVSRQLFDAVPFYAGLTLEEIGGRGVRWQERAAATAFPAGGEPDERPAQLAAPTPENAADLAGYRSVWDAPEVEFSPSLEFLFPHKDLLELERPLARAAASGAGGATLEVVVSDPGLGTLRP